MDLNQEKGDVTRYSKFDNYLKGMERRIRTNEAGFRAHALCFGAVNAFLIILWAMTGSQHPWFLYPLGGWGIGLVHHYMELRHLRSTRRAAEKLPRLTEKGFRIFRKLVAWKDSFLQHGTAAVSVSLFLFMINTITGSSFQWWLIPASVLGLGFSIHAITSGGRGRELERQLALETEGAVIHSPARSQLIQEAAQLESVIRRELNLQKKELGNMGQEILLLLDTYIGGMKDLSRKKEEIQAVLLSHPGDRIRTDIEEYEKKREQAGANTLKAEYTKAISGLESQKRSVKKLEERQEIIDLRLQSSLQNLRQLQLDLARIKTSQMSDSLEQNALEEFRHTSNELAAYIEDMDSGYEELLKE